MFLLGGLPALLAVFIRMRVKESEVWEKTRASDWSHLGQTILSHWKIFLYIVLLMTFMNLSSHGVQDAVPDLPCNATGISIRRSAPLSRPSPA